jgi:two-component system heavy metal sensor histidine kinase CusS
VSPTVRLPRPHTLKGRLALWYAVVLGVVLLAFCTATYFIALSEGEEDEEHEAHAGPGGAERGEAQDRRLLLGLAVGLAAAVSVAVAGGLWIGRRALRPIDRIESIATRLRGDDLSLRIEAHAGEPEEVTRLVVAVNGMLARIESSVGGVRRFTADASHELRTPLASMIATIEVALHRPRDAAELVGAAHSVLEDLRQLSRLVEALLTLARADSGELPVSRVELDVARLVRQTVEPYETIAVERGLHLAISAGGSGTTAFTDPLWLGRAVANLVDNACKFTPSGGAIAIVVTGLSETVRVSVENESAPLTPEERARIFERFYRAPAARGASAGFGLGLSLARDIARQLGGELTLGAGDEGRTRLDLEVARAALPTAAVTAPRGRRPPP